MTEDDARFMNIAIEEARKSTGEDERAHPMVGVVVAKFGKLLAKGHRGELSGGEHAEYTVIERKLGSEIIAGATVYTTLEPCTTRNHPKIPCAERLVERKVSRVVIGMLDPNPDIRGKGQLRLRDANITTDLFPPELMAQVEEINREFLRCHRATGSTGQRLGHREGQEMSPPHKEEPHPAATGRTSIPFQTYVDDVRKISSLTERDQRFRDLVALALRKDAPEWALKITAQISSQTSRESLYTQIVEYYLNRSAFDEANRIIDMLSSLTGKDAARRRVLERRLQADR